MEKQSTKKREWISFRVKPEEYDCIHRRYKKTTCRKLSEYARKVLLVEPVTFKYRNQSADDCLAIMLQLKKDLNGIGNNFNQAVKKLHTICSLPEIHAWLIISEIQKKRFMDKTAEIKTLMNLIYEKWSQESPAPRA